MNDRTLPPMRLRDCLKFFDNLPPETKAQFDDVRNADHFTRHFGFGRFLRNQLLWKFDIALLAYEIEVVKRGYGEGCTTSNPREIEAEANSAASGWCDHDSLSLDLLDVLDRRNRGEIRISDPS